MKLYAQAQLTLAVQKAKVSMYFSAMGSRCSQLTIVAYRLFSHGRVLEISQDSQIPLCVSSSETHVTPLIDSLNRLVKEMEGILP